MSDNSSLFLPPDIKMCKRKKKHCHKQSTSSSHEASSSDISKLIDIIECMNNKIEKLERESDCMRVKIRALCKRVEKLEDQNCSSSEHKHEHHCHDHHDHHDNPCHIEHRLRKLEKDNESLFIVAFDKKI